MFINCLHKDLNFFFIKKTAKVVKSVYYFYYNNINSILSNCNLSLQIPVNYKERLLFR